MKEQVISSFKSSYIQCILRIDMLWQLAHFGLELSSPEEVLKHSCIEVTRELSVKGETESGDLKGTLCDPILDGPPTEQTLLDTMGHIVLEVPVARPECLDQIVEFINKRCPFEYPLRKFGKGKSIDFTYETADDGDHHPVNPQELYTYMLSNLVSKRPTVIHGDQFTEHNVEAHPSEMMIKFLPVPSLLARSLPHTQPLTAKLEKIVKLNNRLKSFMSNPEMNDTSSELNTWAQNPAARAMIIHDLSQLITYNVMTYLDNAIPGIPSDENLPAGIAQLIGTMASLLPENDSSPDIAGTSLHRIVRGINTGEPVLNIYAEKELSENLAFELTKQIAFNRIWRRSGRETQLIYINNLGEIQRMLIGVIEDLYWSPWDGNSNISRDVVVAPRFSNRLIEPPKSKSLAETIKKIRGIDADFTFNLAEYRTLNYLYGLLDGDAEGLEQQIIICESYMDPVLLRPLLRKLRGQNKIGSNVSVVLTQIFFDSAVNYHYTKTPDDFRNLIIALTNLNERRQFDHKEKMFQHIRPTDLKLISTYVKDLTRKEMTQILGEVIIEKGKLELDFLRNYIITYLTRENRSIQHLKPNPKTTRRKLTLEDGYPSSMEVFGKKYSEQLEAENVVQKKNEKLESRQLLLGGKNQEKETLFDSLKGLEPLVQWAKLKGKLFTPDAAEYGFVSYPRGLLLTGVPGCGKTMAAKIIAEEWGMSLHRVNPDDITSRFTGGNEENMRKLLDKMVEDAPCICFVDEAEKLFSQMNQNAAYGAAAHGIDSTESMLLQFMEENEEPVFFIFTCNDLGKMSPAIIDRFDARFFVDLPDVVAREEIVRLMLKERKKGNIPLDHNRLAKDSQNFTGRDIRGAIDEAMMVAFAEGREIEQRDLNDSFANTKPTSIIHAEKIDLIRQLVTEGKVRMANSTRIIVNDAKPNEYDVSVG